MKERIQFYGAMNSIPICLKQEVDRMQKVGFTFRKNFLTASSPDWNGGVDALHRYLTLGGI